MGADLKRVVEKEHRPTCRRAVYRRARGVGGGGDGVRGDREHNFDGDIGAAGRAEHRLNLANDRRHHARLRAQHHLFRRRCMRVSFICRAAQRTKIGGRDPSLTLSVVTWNVIEKAEMATAL